MRNRYVLTILLACLGIIAIISLQGSQKIAQVLAPVDSARNPVNTVQAFYKAVEKGEWLQARAYTTKECWNELEAQGQVKSWQDRITEDDSFDFAGFAVNNSRVDQQFAVINGKPIWLSAQGTIPRATQTITLQQGLGGWRISSIQSEQSAGVVEAFYASLNQGQWEQAKALVQADTWRSLESKGIIAKLKKGLKAGEPYVEVKVLSTKEEANQSMIQAETSWFLPKESKSRVVIKLTKSGDNWVIQQIEGGWPK